MDLSALDELDARAIVCVVIHGRYVLVRTGGNIVMRVPKRTMLATVILTARERVGYCMKAHFLLNFVRKNMEL